jgi:hypothetical protein
VGPGTWIGEPIPTDFTSIPDIPGYIGIIPSKNSTTEHRMYLERLHQYEASQNLPLSDSISKYGATIITLTMLSLASSRSAHQCSGCAVDVQAPKPWMPWWQWPRH